MKLRNTIFLLVLYVAGHAVAQEEEKYENLKVLPKDTDRKTMSRIMRSFNYALGVRCDFCHVGEKGAPLSTYDFASDDKKHKEIARQMMRMVDDMNQNHLKDLGRPGHNEETNCRMCHRGLAEPKTLAESLNKAMGKDGLDGAVAAYGKLRERYYGRDAYDFGEWTLLKYAESLSDDKKLDEALTFAKLNLNHFPKSDWTQYYIGEIYALKEDKTNAITHFKKALELNPNNEDAKKRVEELSK